MCSSRSAVMMYCSSGVRRKVVRSDACPRTSVPFEGFSCAVREPRFDAPGAGSDDFEIGSGWRG